MLKKILIVFIIVLCFLITRKEITLISSTEAKKIVYLDAGHGGPDGGAVVDDVTEANINLSIALILKNILEKNGYQVLLIRDGDYDLAPANSKNRKRDDLVKRVELINNSNCDIFISIHANIYTSSKIRGAQTFYKENNQKSEVLANLIQESIIANLKNTSRHALPLKNKYILDNTTKVGCIVEVGFLSNPEEKSLLMDKSYQTKMAESIFEGIKDYFSSSILKKNFVF